MRIAWLDTGLNPWTTENAWNYLTESGLTVLSCTSVEEAQAACTSDLSAIVISHQVDGAADFLTSLRTNKSTAHLPTILISPIWGKKEFRAHSQTPGAAHRYAKVPMPPEGFVEVLCNLLKITPAELKGSPASLGSLADELLQNTDSGALSPADQNSQSFSIEKPTPSPQATAPNQEEVETLRRYLRLREEELANLQTRFTEMQADYQRLQNEVGTKDKEIRTRVYAVEEAERKLKTLEERIYELEKELILEKENSEVAVKNEQEKERKLVFELKEAKDRYESLKSRVRKDLRKIRVREHDLESKLDLLRTDAERMVEARDSKVLELQRKIDALEFDLDQLQDSRHKALAQAERYLAKLARVARTLGLAVSMIDEEAKAEDSRSDDEDLFGGAAEGMSAPESMSIPTEPALSKELPPAAAFKLPKVEPAATENLEQTNLDADELLAEHDNALGTEQENILTPDDSSAPSLSQLATDGEPTRVVSRENLNSAQESVGKMDLAADIDAAG